MIRTYDSVIAMLARENYTRGEGDEGGAREALTFVLSDSCQLHLRQTIKSCHLGHHVYDRDGCVVLVLPSCTLSIQVGGISRGASPESFERLLGAVQRDE
jgi:hypothetical protein